MRTLFKMLPLLVFSASACADDLTVDQQLIIACHRLDVSMVVRAIRDGADLNARFGKGGRRAFEDKWSLGSPLSGKMWTPLIALARASRYPDPPRTIKNTIADLEWAIAAKEKYPKHNSNGESMIG